MFSNLKKTQYLAFIKTRNRAKRFASLSTIASCFGLKRDAYYKYKSRADKSLKLEQQIINIVSKKRKSLPREGVRKLIKSLDDEFTKANIKVGRDTLFNVLIKHNTLTLRKKTSTRTTNSYHRFYKYSNIIKDLEVTRANQVWVSDITYIRTVKGFCYLALITDMHSRKIVGYDLSDSLELKGCVGALNKAIYQAKNIKQLIHHSGRGIQYCSNQYTQILKRKKIDINMTEENHCYENAMSERVNGILKDEFYLDQTFDNVAHVKKAAKNAINLYNKIRLHLSLDYKTPNMVSIISLNSILTCSHISGQDKSYTFEKKLQVSEKFTTDFETSYEISYTLKNPKPYAEIDSIKPYKFKVEILKNNKPIKIFDNNSFLSESGQEYELKLKFINANSKPNSLNIGIETNVPGPTYELLIEREYE
ncbi:Transposase [Winogradskyella psychrotolerans RS-3]|uniref:Transposase n=1 Tax=Winogradskyella psychrotolerans RS-3 TaxID=641526 RepID=S7VQX3_9FLAO|nr:IS3 family transposase [Winogradskyella psychrotolerans]EPR71737.1 Transposase [Winogradskyella psychrotolerans RS-3]